MIQRWVLEHDKGTRRSPRWVEVACFIGNERCGSDLSVRVHNWGKYSARWHPLGEEFPCSYGGNPNAVYDKGEF